MKKKIYIYIICKNKESKTLYFSNSNDKMKNQKKNVQSWSPILHIKWYLNPQKIKILTGANPKCCNFNKLAPSTCPFSFVLPIITRCNRAYTEMWKKDNRQIVERMIMMVDSIVCRWWNVRQAMIVRWKKLFDFLTILVEREWTEWSRKITCVWMKKEFPQIGNLNWQN